jgi:hypothetical protein
LAPRFFSGHLEYGYILYVGFMDFRGAQQADAKAAELSPDDEDVLPILAKFEASMGHGTEALALIRRAIKMDSLSS